MQLYMEGVFLPISQQSVTASSSRQVPTALLGRMKLSCIPPGHNIEHHTLCIAYELHIYRMEVFFTVYVGKHIIAWSHDA